MSLSMRWISMRSGDLTEKGGSTEKSLVIMNP